MRSSESVWVRAPGSLSSGNSSAAILWTSLIAAQAAFFADLEQDVAGALEIIDERRLGLEPPTLLVPEFDVEFFHQRIERITVVGKPAVKRNVDWVRVRVRVGLAAGRGAESPGCNPGRFAQIDLLLEFDPLSFGPICGNFPGRNNLPVNDQLHLTDGRHFATDPNPSGHCVRARSRDVDSLAGRLSVNLEQEQRPGGHEAAAGGRAFKPGPHVLRARHTNIGAAIGQPAARRVVTRSQAWEAIANIQQPIPVGEPQFAVDAELQQLDAVNVALDRVRINRCVGQRFGVPAVAVEGKASLVARLAGQEAIKRTVVGVDALVPQHQILAEIQVEVTVRAAVLLAREDVKIAARPLGSRAQAAKLRCRESLHDARVRTGRLVVRQDAPKTDVLGLHQVENRLIVGVGLPPEMQVRVAGKVTGLRQGDIIGQFELDRLRLPGRRL